MFKNEGQPKIQRMNAPSVEKGEMTSKDLLQYFPADIVEHLRKGDFKTWSKTDPTFAFLPHVLGTPIGVELSGGELSRIATVFRNKLDAIRNVSDRDVAFDTYELCVEVFMLKYLGQKIDPILPFILTGTDLARIDEIQSIALKKGLGGYVDFMLIEAWRKLTDPSRATVSTQTILMSIEFTKRLRQQVDEGGSLEILATAVIRLMFALSILAPQYPLIASAKESEQTQKCLRLEDWFYRSEENEITDDEVVLRSMVYALKARTVTVDEHGLHVERGASSAQPGPTPKPIQRNI